jgi:hypothetical protein
MEKILFSMPSDGEAFLAALAAVQAWVREQEEQIANALAQIADVEQQTEAAYAEKKLTFGRYQMLLDQIKQSRDAQDARRWELFVHLFPSFELFRPAFGEGVTFVTKGLVEGPHPPLRGAFDMVFQFDQDCAYELGKTTERHLAQSFGIMIGAETGSLPDLSDLEPAFYEWEMVVSQPYDLLLLEHEGSSTVLGFVQKNHPNYEVHEMVADDPGIFGDVQDADMVVGPRSFATYLASALGKRVVELYPDDRYKRWLSKWDNPNYQMIFGKDFPPALVYRTMEQLWSRPAKELPKRTPQQLVRKRGALVGLAAAFAQGGL